MNPTSLNNNIIDILKWMYEDNINLIESHMASIDNIRQSNTNIRNILVRLLDNQRNTRANTSTNTSTNTRTRLNSTRNQSERTIEYYPFTTFTEENISSLLNTFLHPVEVYPTPTQIVRATRRVFFSDILNPVNRSCPISLEPFNDRDQVTLIRFCGHVFNSEQLSIWFRSNCRCPVCRYDIRNYSAPEQSETQEPTPSSGNANEVVASVDASNNSYVQNQGENLQNNIANAFTRYFDIILDGRNNSDIHNAFLEYPTDTASLNTILNALQRRQH